MIVVVGLSHRSAPLAVREQLALDQERVRSFLRGLVQGPPVGEAFAVSTCNRVEVFAAAADGRRSQLDGVAERVLAGLCEIGPGARGHLYSHVGTPAVRHLFRVAASLDSLVVGEPQILGQVKDAYDLARAAGTLGPTLNRIVPRAIRSAKRVRTETSIGAGQVSVPSVAVDLAASIFGDLRKHTAVLIGSGDMGETVARLLRQLGARLVVVGRNQTRVAELSRDLGAEGRPFEALSSTLVEADVVVTTTSAPSYIVDREMLARNRRARRGRSLFFIDLAVPRDVDPAVEGLDGVFLYNVDDLSRVVAETLNSRKQEAERAEQIVAEEVTGYDRWAEAEQVTPLVIALRDRLRSVLEAEIERSLGGKLRSLPLAERDGLSRMTEAALNKMLHNPTVRLRALAADAALRPDLEQYLSVVSDLFELSAARAEDAQGAGGAEGAGSAPAAELEEASQPEGGEAAVEALRPALSSGGR